MLSSVVVTIRKLLSYANVLTLSVIRCPFPLNFDYAFSTPFVSRMSAVCELSHWHWVTYVCLASLIVPRSARRT